MQKPLLIIAVTFFALWFGWRSFSNRTDMRVLFVGDEYTQANDLPDIVDDLAKANGVNLEIDVMADPGLTLATHASDSDVNDALAGGNYDVVILQEDSDIPAVRERLLTSTLPALRRMGVLTASSGTEVILFETWADRDGAALSGFNSFASMQEALSDGYSSMASEIRADVSSVGATWWSVRTSNPDILLHSPDGKLPTEEGSYLAAAVLTTSILGEELENFANGHVDDEIAEQLLELAS